MMKRKALLTGASRGIGLAIAEALKENNIEVLAPSRSELDLSNNGSVDSFLKERSADIDILINNAGINLLGGIIELKDTNIEETIKVNLISPLRLIRGVLPSMIKKGYGRIVSISSIWSVVSKPGRVAYSASKGGLNAVTRSIAAEVAKHNILVNAVAPGLVDTELTRKNLSESEIEKIKGDIPLMRLAAPKEIAEVVLFLCSEKNTYITGQTIIVDGGFTCL